ncbi:PIR Superfamily Protein [Plasmodium ovale wallikeri]|uniref:PIR Superfamily Protein n=1 Tax=Plasmodium ovale wallikeri TaxID=864142 RepID=A0A1A9AII9_PLAOA|nr:PIR Superfamily Protein [Plasmodium ovale wallikeri]
MTLNKGKGKEIYTFCTNAHYYEVLLKHVKNKKGKEENEQKCDNLSTSMFLEKSSATEICKEFKSLYESFNIYRGKKTLKKDIYSDYDCDFLNYWLNDKLRGKVSGGSNYVKLFYEKMKEQDGTVFSDHEELGNHMQVIDPYILENMKLLYKLYDNAEKIINIIRDQVYEDEENEEGEEKSEKKRTCTDYKKECDENYKNAMDRCLNSNDDFYKALKFFKGSYEILNESSPKESNECNSSRFSFFPVYDPVPEKEKEKRIMTIKISSILSVLSLALPLIYKFTPFGPFLRRKINVVRNRWLNQDKNVSELLSMYTDNDDNIYENEEYNIGYYSEAN